MSSKTRHSEPDERVAKAEKLLEEGKTKYEALEDLEKELGTIKRASEGCENVFHSLVEVSEAILSKHGQTARNHIERMDKLSKIGRGDLADLYAIAKDHLHTSGYYGQQFNTIQKHTLERVEKKVKEEIEKL
ncbi:hypothetical protein AKJ40_02080 [candidate division MSBL1 archaeon SCGC-AAA259M10]|uniref:Uncharacterized protein n=3 Tax=candidate division MSBL1 TaxID=215777 RepID=A0A133U355_9EURY|nr:hypothetical protein AKJ62_04810 [candidate division MSBL1 archaeon SCGC-AAA259D14]KXA94428.1 hypothetical protein AKJ36_02915 [candidate division MSBL1 archaeon SCGC-AAA259I07]KXA99966.1 hypothetical protein AKJ40_02080 [candidate division MSBL1 archaeon SCGC-AAA259M10]